MSQFSIDSMSFIQIFGECGKIVIKLMLASPDKTLEVWLFFLAPYRPHHAGSHLRDMSTS
jgi:hypothetical protein